MRADFIEVMASIGVSEAGPLYDDLVAAYSGGGRHYHDLIHIENFLAFLEPYRGQVQNWPAVYLAVWFHDAIYDAKAADNEQQSAKLARTKLGVLGAAPDLIEEVAALVIATEKHEPVEGIADCALFLDADLSILGAPPAQYDYYTENVRKEYHFVPEDAYRAGRAQVMERFLKRPRIYFTDEVHEVLDNQARENLARELSALKA